MATWKSFSMKVIIFKGSLVFHSKFQISIGIVDCLYSLGRHGNTGQNFLNRPDPKNTWPEPDFFDPKQQWVDPWPDPLKKSLISFLITSWYFVHKTQNIKTNNKIQMYQHQCLSLIRQKTSQWTMKHWNITQLHTQVSDNNRQGLRTNGN